MNNQKWQKAGHIFCPDGSISWMQSHAAVPIAEHLEGDLFRIYFSCRDGHNRSHTGSLVLDISRPQDILEISHEPVLQPGNLGEFDDAGAMASWLVEGEGEHLLYYIGWNQAVSVPFRNSIGLAGSRNGRFERLYTGPILDRTKNEPHFCASCCVHRSDDQWRMWYLSCTGWQMNAGTLPEHRYHIKYAESDDGVDWRRHGQVAIDYASDEELAISRPCVLRRKQGWVMWYSYRKRGGTYRIGYARSEDGVAWQRHDSLVDLDVSSAGWDSEMIEYPFVFDHAGHTYMLYNGNGYGETGFGIAVLNS